MKEPFAQLLFKGAPKKSWEAVGTLEANDGHIFRIFIRASLKKDLDNFLNRLNRGEINIRVQVLPEPYQGERLPPVEGPAPNEVDNTITMGGVSIGISRLKMNEDLLPKSYRIRYTIDPPIARDDSFSATFSDQSEANIRCDVSLGSVGVVVYQLSVHHNRINNPAPSTAAPAQSVIINQPRANNSFWEVEVTGKSASNYFSLSYAKVVL